MSKGFGLIHRFSEGIDIHSPVFGSSLKGKLPYEIRNCQRLGGPDKRGRHVIWFVPHWAAGENQMKAYLERMNMIRLGVVMLTLARVPFNNSFKNALLDTAMSCARLARQPDETAICLEHSRTIVAILDHAKA